MILRPATQGDHTVIADLWFDSWMSIGIANDTDLSRTELAARFAEEATVWTLIVAEMAGEIAGFLALLPDEGKLDQLFVAPHRKGQGVGGALLERAKSEITGDIWLWTAAENHRACTWYEREGFTECAREYSATHRRERVKYILRRSVSL